MALELEGNAENILALKTVLNLDQVTNTALAAKQPAEEGKGLSEANFTETEKTKLSGIAEDATANSTDAFLRNRDNHTGTQEMETVAGLGTALANRIEKMIDLEEAPVATITSISVLYPGATEPVVLLPVTSMTLPYEDVDGRTPYTEDGTFEEGGGFYNNRINYSALVSQWIMALDGGEGGVTWDSHRADLTANGVESWPWTSAFEISVPTITPTFTTTAPGVAGQRYRVKESQGKYRHYEKQPDNSIRDLGLFNTNGDEFVLGVTARRIDPADFASIRPLKDELVWLGDSGMWAMGDGLQTVKYLRWNGLHRIELTEDYLNSGWVELTGVSTAKLITNSCDVEIVISEDVKAAGLETFSLVDYSRSSPTEPGFSPTNVKYCIHCPSALTGGTVRFVHIMRKFDLEAEMGTPGELGTPATLLEALRYYDYADIAQNGFIFGHGLWVMHAENATFAGV